MCSGGDGDVPTPIDFVGDNERIARILRDYSDAGGVNTLLPLWGFVDGETFMTKAGHVGLVGQPPRCGCGRPLSSAEDLGAAPERRSGLKSGARRPSLPTAL